MVMMITSMHTDNLDQPCKVMLPVSRMMLMMLTASMHTDNLNQLCKVTLPVSRMMEMMVMMNMMVITVMMNLITHVNSDGDDNVR